MTRRLLNLLLVLAIALLAQGGLVASPSTTASDCCAQGEMTATNCPECPSPVSGSQHCCMAAPTLVLFLAHQPTLLFAQPSARYSIENVRGPTRGESPLLPPPKFA